MTSRHSPTLLQTAALALLMGLSVVQSGCDDAGEQRKDAAPTQPGKAAPPDPAAKSEGNAAALTQNFKDPAEAIFAFNKWYSDCFSARTSATNRETCKLDCAPSPTPAWRR